MLRVLTLNIAKTDAGWRSRREAIVATLQRCEPGIVCLQEVLDGERGNQADWIAARLGGWSVAYAGEPLPDRPERVGNAVLSRWPIEERGSARLPDPPAPYEERRVVVHARTRGVDVFSTHFVSGPADALTRERQVVALDRFVRERSAPDAAIGPIVGGDLNAEPDATAVRFLAGLTSLRGVSTHLQDAWRLAGVGPGFTWSNANPLAAPYQEPDARLDYIFSGFHGFVGAGRPVECHVAGDEPVDGVWPSDHFGVLAVLQDV